MKGYIRQDFHQLVFEFGKPADTYVGRGGTQVGSDEVGFFAELFGIAFFRGFAPQFTGNLGVAGFFPFQKWIPDDVQADVQLGDFVVFDDQDFQSVFQRETFVFPDADFGGGT